MFSILPIVAKCEWWKYRELEYPLKEKNSQKRPIFAVCTSPQCPHCKGLPTALHEYSDSLGNRTKIIFTNINCASGDVCNHLGIRGVPTFLLIRGTDSKFWTQCNDRTPAGWTSFLAEQFQVQVQKISNNAQEKAAIAKSIDGGTTFILTLKESDKNTYLKQFRKFASRFGLIGCSFYYKINEHAISPYIVAYHSKQCVQKKQITMNKNETLSFINEHKWSSYHHFDRIELSEAMKSKSLIVEVNNLNMSEKFFKSISKLESTYCGKANIGWVDPQEDSQILSFSKKKIEDVPYFFVSSPESKCFKVENGSPDENSASQLLESAINGKECRKIPKIRTGERRGFTKLEVGLVITIFVLILVGYFIYELTCSSEYPKLE